MNDTSLTRRRVVQGAGAVGLATIGGTSVAAQQQEGGGEAPAIRLAHLSPDVPEVDVHLQRVDTEGEDETTNGANGGDDQSGDAPEGDPVVEGVSFGNVSGYNEVEAGGYRLQLVPSDGGLLGGLFGGGNDQTVIYQQDVDVSDGQSYTVVTFGELSRGLASTDDDAAGDDVGEDDSGETDGATENGESNGQAMDGENQTGGDAAGAEADDEETGSEQADEEGRIIDSLAFGDDESVTIPPGNYTLEIREAGTPESGGEADVTGDANESDGGGANGNETDSTDDASTEGPGGEERAFQARVLEDDLSTPEQGTARLRVFHAVPDVEELSITRMDAPAGAQEDDPGEGAGEVPGNGTEQDDDQFRADQDQEQEDIVRANPVEPEQNVAYSGFAAGYFFPQEAPAADEDADGDGDDGVDDNGTDAGGGDSGESGDGGNGDGGSVEGVDEEEAREVAESGEGEDFQFVMIEDAEGGERANGGSNEGFFGMEPLPQD